MGAERVGDVKEDAALSAHVLGVGAGAGNTGCAVQRGAVSTALHISGPLQPAHQGRYV